MYPTHPWSNKRNTLNLVRVTHFASISSFSDKIGNWENKEFPQSLIPSTQFTNFLRKTIPRAALEGRTED
jgi:hypothetical protein